MKKAAYASLPVVLALAGFLYGSAHSGPASTPAAGERWEYCAVSKAGYAGSSRGGTYWVSYFKDGGVDIVEIEEKVSDQGGQVAKAIAKLGEEGWEMVLQADLPVKTGRVEAIYFKRPRQ